MEESYRYSAKKTIGIVDILLKIHYLTLKNKEFLLVKEVEYKRKSKNESE